MRMFVCLPCLFATLSLCVYDCVDACTSFCACVYMHHSVCTCVRAHMPKIKKESLLQLSLVADCTIICYPLIPCTDLLHSGVGSSGTTASVQ